MKAEHKLAKSVTRIKHFVCGRGLVSRYGMDGPMIESRWERDFLRPSRTALVPTIPFYAEESVFFPGGKAVGAWRGLRIFI